MSEEEEADIHNKQGKRRFADISEEQLQVIVDNKDAKNTKRSTSQAVRIFREYLQEKSLSSDFDLLPLPDLDNLLGKLYAEARSKTEDLYKMSSLNTLKHGLTRHIHSKTEIDISKDTRFEGARTVFKAVSTDLKCQGLGGVEHYPPIVDEDLRKAYLNFNLNNNKSLQQNFFY